MSHMKIYPMKNKEIGIFKIVWLTKFDAKFVNESFNISMKRSQVFINHITSEKYMEYRANLHISRIRVNLEFSA